MNVLNDTFPTSYHAPQTRSKKLLDFHLRGLGFCILFMLKIHWIIIVTIIFFIMCLTITSLLRGKLPPFYQVFHSVFYSLCTFISLIEIMYYCISMFMVASLIHLFYNIGYLRYLYTIYYISAVISCRK